MGFARNELETMMRKKSQTRIGARIEMEVVSEAEFESEDDSTNLLDI